MKILIIRNFPSYMDVENNTYNIQEAGLAKALVRKGNVCDIIFWTDKEERIVTIPVDNCGAVQVFYKNGKTALKNTVYINCEQLYKQYDILQPCEYNQIQAWQLARKYPHKTVIYHGPYYSKFNKRYNIMCNVFDLFFLKSYIKCNTKFIVKSEMAKDFLVNKGIRQGNVCVAGVGIDAQILSNGNNPCNESIYQRMVADSDKLKVLYVGHFEERRKLPFVLEVFSKVLKKQSNARLYLVGTGSKKYLQMVWDFADNLNIREAIVWQEKMEQKYLSNVYKLTDFFLLPTEYEIFGMVLLEAMYYGTVVLTTRNGGSSTLIQSGENGYILDQLDSTLWTDKIVDTYSDKEKMKNLQDKASVTITKNYKWDALADIFVEQYKKRYR